MKKSLIALAVLGSIAGVASAQSSVTLYGVLDVSARHTDNGSGDTRQALASGGLSSSRWGLKGTEVISSDLSAGFVLESGLNVDNGSSADTARFFNRRATVSLISKELGEVRVGRDKTPVYTAQETFDPFGAVGTSLGSVTNLIGKNQTNQNTLTRFDNAIQYFLPTMGGFYGQFAVSAGESEAGKGHSGNHSGAGRIGYATGPLNVSIALSNTKVQGDGVTLRDENVNETFFGVSYNLGFATVSGLYENRQMGYPSSLVVSGDATKRTQNVVLVGVSAPVSDNGSARVSFTKLNDDAKSAGKSLGASQFALGYTYNLSKRTSVYSTLSIVSNDDAAKYSAASSNAMPAVAGNSYGGVEFGVRHSF